jgi:hypothetical protein
MTHGALAASNQALISKKQSPHGPAQKWHSSGFGFHKKSMVNASSSNQEILALRPPKHSRNGSRTGFLHTKNGSTDFGAAKAVGGLLHQPAASQLMARYEKLKEM